MSTDTPLLGIFVGGSSTRMGGHPKGRLHAKDTGEPLVVRLARLAREAGLSPVWVGRAQAYRELVPGLPELSDEPAGIGPLGGLCALLRAAGEAPVIAVACDMPQVSLALLERLLSENTEAMVLAPRSEAGLWEPLCARYRAVDVLPICEAALAEGVRSFQQLFARLPVCELPLSSAERGALIDWDRPEDMSG
jgi:molybdopterin-guanine dinucleotide biosynthesis protein A